MRFVSGVFLVACLAMCGQNVMAGADRVNGKSLLPQRVLAEAQARVDAKWYPTLVIAYVDGDRSEVETFGRLSNGAKPNGDTVYEIGSITKTFTAALLADEIRSGRVKTDTPVTALLPDYNVPARNGVSITLADLATQSSGLPYMPENMRSADAANPYADYDAAKLKAFLAGYVLKRNPGEAYEYSNLGFGLLGFALTQPQHYGEALRAKIFQPLGMTMTAVGLTDRMKAHLATGHNNHNREAENWRFDDALAGCGSIDSTGNDMLRYLKANMAIGGTSMSSSFQLAQQPLRDVNKTERIGMAWMTRASLPEDVIWHNGTTFGYASFIGFTADRKRGVVILTNIGGSVDDLGFAALSDAPLRTYKTVAVDRSILSSDEGVFKTADGGLIKIYRQDGQLYAQAKGEDGIPLFALSSEEFFTRIDGFHLIFPRNGDGHNDSIVLRQQGGVDRVAPRLEGAEAAAALSKF
ncbi:serine hydrolase domain-containing protein [Terriglobus roseus]|uniref:CubicO group peptidase, beta-lactamase class C family n=1 Tax=Terriglobus roseus TaxID=392734 RepID=A0A1G7FXY4_9BACT|nr:serine hydrolase domain-containing protein [Terriglobus roseus]SDE80736.1 CubicO group peptidase, beta-lactamase class C family [Terriglobus roseus]